MGNVVEIDGVIKRFGRGGAQVEALRGVTLHIPEGEFVTVAGASGCGKSTLLNLVAALDDPTEGSVVICGEDLSRLTEGARSNLRLRQIGFVFQGFNLLPRLTVEHNITWRVEQLGFTRRRARQRARSVLEQAGVPPKVWLRYPGELSGGEQQRVATARALVNEPRLLLADEPTGNLDSTTGTRILDLLSSLNVERRMSVILVTHDPLASTYGQRTVELRDGRIVTDVGSLAASRARKMVAMPGRREA